VGELSEIYQYVAVRNELKAAKESIVNLQSQLYVSLQEITALKGEIASSKAGLPAAMEVMETGGATCQPPKNPCAVLLGNHHLKKLDQIHDLRLYLGTGRVIGFMKDVNY